mmetsp:Transcript_13766/g.22786  ORF Transcript_13766/g.22786 Transcript_13766/m.22786 type:complete len:564 (-) Transcript_13766:19-1710(-)
MSSLGTILRAKVASSSGSSTAALIAAFSGGLLATTAMVRKTSLQQQNKQQQSSNENNNTNEDTNFLIETDLMERIAQKPYLQAFTSNDQHPRGVPHRLRILAIDVPEMRTAFDGECRINLSKVYADDIAPAKLLPKEENNNNNNNGGDGKETSKQKKKKAKLTSVAQKTLAKSLIKCRKRKKIGVELLEASVEDLNPHNMRKTHQFGNLVSYDPGKYATRPVASRRQSKLNNDDDDDNDEESLPIRKKATASGGTSIRKDSHEGTVLATEDDEIDAPWNQYAWIEEMQLRINGKVPFGSTLSAASSLTRILHGNVYRTTVPSNRTFWEWFLPPILHRDPAGSEGNTNRRSNWASHKPHAVIADGAAMQRVPGSMRFLQKTCQEANVPLFIVNDPRVWGGNTHQDLNDALQDMRKTIKYNIVQQSMRGSAFGRGRLLGQLETEAKWQAKDMGRRTRQAVKDANKRLQQERANDWSTLDEENLHNKLVDHKVIEVRKAKKGADEVPTTSYTAGMVKLARQCVESLVVVAAEEEAKMAKPAKASNIPSGSEASEGMEAADMAAVGA